MIPSGIPMPRPTLAPVLRPYEGELDGEMMLVILEAA
jgi:hypothetical protein